MIWFWVIRLLFIGGVALIVYWMYKSHISDSEIKRALRAAKMLDGRMSIVDLSMDMNISIARAERILKEMVELGLATIDIENLKREGGEIVYIVPRALPKEPIPEADSPRDYFQEPEARIGQRNFE